MTISTKVIRRAPRPAKPVESTASDRGGVRLIPQRLRQFVCGLRQHDLVMHFEQHRVALRCNACGYQSPGWDVSRDRQRRGGDFGQGTPHRRAEALRPR